MESNKGQQRTLEYVKRKRTNERAILQGIISLSMFLFTILVVFFAYIPLLVETNKIVAQRETIETESNQLQAKYDVISGTPPESLQQGLSISRRFIPDTLRVAELATFVNTNAKAYDLVVTRLGVTESLSEVQTEIEAEEAQKLVGSEKLVDKVLVGRVEGPFAFTGKREKIFEFLDFLVTGGYATNFDKVTMSGNSETDVWVVSFTTSYYYLQKLSGVDPKTPLINISYDTINDVSPTEAGSVLDQQELNEGQ